MAASSARSLFSKLFYNLNSGFCTGKTKDYFRKSLNVRSVSNLKVKSRNYSGSISDNGGTVAAQSISVLGSNNNNNTGSSARDPGPLFIDPRVQSILERLTGVNLEKIFQFRSTAANKKSQRYEFMTEKSLQTAMTDIQKKVRNRLQMPPVLKERETIDEVLELNPHLEGLNKHRILFIDISLGIPNRKRTIVARDVNGTLRKASWDERDRMISTFFPKPNQKCGTPRVFLDEHMKAAFDECKYKFVLDRACHQYEPDNPAFIQICRKAYEHIDGTKSYDVLHSTRHYGPLVFYLAFNKRVDGLLQHLIQKDRIEEAADVVRLYHIVQPDCKSLRSVNEKTNRLAILKAFTRHDAVKRSHLELALQTHEELERQRREREEEKAHRST